MGRSCNWAVTIFRPLEHDLFETKEFDYGERHFILKAVSVIEHPTHMIESQHRHLWLKSTQKKCQSSGSVIGKGALLKILQEVFGADCVIPYLKPCLNIYNWAEYCNKHANSTLSDSDNKVLEVMKSKPRYSDNDILASLIPIMGLQKCNEYKSKMNLLRDYMKLNNQKSLPSVTTAKEFVDAVYETLLTADEIEVPCFDDDVEHVDRVKYVFHHLVCMHCFPRYNSSNGDGHFGLYLFGEPGSGKTTMLTGMDAFIPPPDKGVGKMNTSCPILTYDDWDPSYLFKHFHEYIMRIATGHDVNVSITGSSRNIGSKWVVVTSNHDFPPLTGRAVIRRFIKVRLQPLKDNSKVMSPDSRGLKEAFIDKYLSLNYEKFYDPINNFMSTDKTHLIGFKAYRKHILSLRDCHSDEQHAKHQANQEENLTFESTSASGPSGSTSDIGYGSRPNVFDWIDFSDDGSSGSSSSIDEQQTPIRRDVFLGLGNGTRKRSTPSEAETPEKDEGEPPLQVRKARKVLFPSDFV